jgi:hypothetical protein
MKTKINQFDYARQITNNKERKINISNIQLNISTCPTNSERQYDMAWKGATMILVREGCEFKPL